MNKLTIFGAVSYMIGIWLVKTLSMDGLSLFLAIALLVAILHERIEDKQKKSAQKAARSDPGSAAERE